MTDQPHELVITVDEVVIPTRMTLGDKRILGHRVGDRGICFRVSPVKRETPFVVEDGAGRLLLNGVLCPESL